MIFRGKQAVELFFGAAIRHREKSKNSQLVVSRFVCSRQFNLLSLSMKCCSLLSLRVVCFWISLHFLNWNETKWEEKCENVECCYFLLVFPYWNHPITITNDTLQGKGFPRSEIKSEGKPSHWKFRGSEWVGDSKGCILVVNSEKFSFFNFAMAFRGICELICFLGSLEKSHSVYHCVQVVL